MNNKTVWACGDIVQDRIEFIVNNNYTWYEKDENQKRINHLRRLKLTFCDIFIFITS